MTMQPDISEIQQTVWLDGYEEKGKYKVLTGFKVHRFITDTPSNLLRSQPVIHHCYTITTITDCACTPLCKSLREGG